MNEDEWTKLRGDPFDDPFDQRQEKTRALKQAMMQELLTGRTRLVARAGADHAEVKT